MKNQIEFYQFLCRNYPHIFNYENKYATPDTQSGWNSIIISLSEKINDYVKGWREEDKPKVMQIKEKFGRLRYYITTSDNVIFKLIRKAEDESVQTCETCGNKNDIKDHKRGQRKYGWIKRLCENCGEEWEKLH